MAFDFSKISQYLRAPAFRGRSIAGQPLDVEQQAPDVQSYVASRAQPTAPKVGDRLYAQYDQTGVGSTTTNKTDYPLYFDPVQRTFTIDQTGFPALYGMTPPKAPIGPPGAQHISPAALGQAAQLQEQERRRAELASHALPGPSSSAWSALAPRAPMTSLEVQSHNAYIKQLAARQQEADKALRSLTSQIGVGGALPGTDTWRSIQQQRQALIEEIESINRRALEEPVTVLVEGPTGEPTPITFKGIDPGSWAPFGRQSTLTSDLVRAFNWEIRPVHAILEGAREQSPFLDFVGRGLALIAGAPGTAGGLAWREVTSPLTFLASSFSNIPVNGGFTLPIPTFGGNEEINFKRPSFAVSPNVDPQEAISHLVLAGWDRDEAERIVSDLRRGEGLWSDRRAWYVVDTHARLAPMMDKINLMDKAWGRWLASSPSTPEALRAFEYSQSYQGQREATIARIQHNVELGAETTAHLDRMTTLTSGVQDYRLTDVTGEVIGPMMAEARGEAEAAVNAWFERDDLPTYSFRYTWILDDRGAESEAQAKEAIIDATLQLGRLPEPWEIEEITNRFTNPLAELAGDATLDPLNLIPVAVMDRIFVGPVKALIRGTGSGVRVAGTALDNLIFKVAGGRPINWISAALKAESIGSAAGRQGHNLVAVLQSAARSSPEVSGVIDTLNLSLRALADPASVPLGELERRGIREWHLSQLDNIIESMMHGRKPLTRDQAVKALIETVQGTADEAGTISNSLDEFFRHIPNRIQTEILSNQRLWENGPVEGLIADFAKLTGANLMADGKVVHKSWRHFFTELSRWQSKIWSAHVKLLLTARPGFTIWNFMDSMTRALLWGASPFDDVETIYRQQSRMGGFIGELIDAWSHGEGLIDPQLTRRILSGEMDLKHGLASAFYEGWKKGGNVFDKWTKGWSVINSLTEATWRTRLYHRQFIKEWAIAKGLLDNVLPGIFAKHGVQEGPLMDAFTELYRENEYTPARMLQAIDELVSGRKAAGGVFVTNDVRLGLGQVVGQAQADEVLSEISRALRQLADDGNLTDSTIDALLNKIQRSYKDRVAAQMENAASLKASVGGVNAGAKLETPPLPSAEELVARAEGRAPVASTPEGIITVYRVRPTGWKPGDPDEWWSADEAYARTIGESGGEMATREVSVAEWEQAKARAAEVRRATGAQGASAQPNDLEGQITDVPPQATAAAAVEEGAIGRALTEELQEVDRIVDDQLVKGVITPQQSAAYKARVRESGVRWASSRRHFAEARGAANATKLQHDAAVLAGTAQLDPQIGQAAAYADVFEDGTERFLSGAHRNFTLNGPNGPLRVSVGADAVFVGKRWDQWFIMRADAWDNMAAQLDGVTALIEKGDYAELARRFEASELPSWRQMWESVGFEFDVAEDGTLLSFRFPRNAYPNVTYTLRNRPWMIDEFLAQNRSSLGLPQKLYDYNIAFMDEPFISTEAMKQVMGKADEVADAVAQGDVIIPQAAGDATTVTTEIAARKVVSPDERAAWEAVVNNPEIKIKYPAAKEGFEPFQDWANREIANLRRTGTAESLEKARILEAQLVRARQSYRALLVERGLLDVVEMPLPSTNMIDEGTRTYLNMAGEVSQGEASLDDAIEQVRLFAKDQAASGGWRTAQFDPVQGQAMRSAVAEASDLMDRAIQVTQRGSKSVAGVSGWDNRGTFLGKVFDGALPTTNKVMIDYSTQSKFLRYSRNFFPFIRFQLKSIPFWVETMAMRPALMAFYFKYLQASSRYAYQYGAIDVKGNPRPSLAGYVPVPGTGTWVNLFAPISMRYLFPREDYTQEETATELSPLETITNYLAQTGQFFGVGVHPWVMPILFGFNVLDPHNTFRYSAIPQTRLLPPSIMRSIEESLRRRKWGGVQGELGLFVANLLDPELDFRDYMIERRVLVNAMNVVSDNTRDIEWRRAYMATVANALMYDTRQNPDGTPLDQEAYDLWERARDQMANEEWANGMMGYFTGIYAKPFTDADGELERVRREINSLRMTLNDEIGVEVLGYDMDAERRWTYYSNQRYNTPEGYLYGLRNIIGWAQSPDSGEQLYGDDRLKLIADRVRADQKIDAFFEGSVNARNTLQRGLATLPIGAASALKEAYYDEYAKTMSGIWDEETRMLMSRYNNFIGYKPTALVYQQAREIWFEALRNLAPQWNFEEGETYTKYRERYDAWLEELPSIATPMALQMRDYFLRDAGLEWADPENKPENLMVQLIMETTKDGYDAWVKENDSVYQAIDSVHGKYYLEEYYSGVEGKNNEDRILFQRTFDRKYPNGVTDEQYIEWIKKEYGEKYRDGQILVALHGRTTTTPEQRQEQGSGPLKPVLNDIFDELSVIAPGTEFGDFMDAYRSVGGDEGDIDVVYNPLTSQGTKEIDFPSDKSKEWAEGVLGRIREAKRIMGLDNISDPELRDRSGARKLNDQFRQTVEQNLGSDFYTVYGYYNGLSLSEQSEFKKSNKSDYARIEAYRKMRDAFGEQNPLWAKYYMEEKKKSSGGGGGGGARGGGGGGSRARAAQPPGGFASPGLRSTLDAHYLAPHNLGRAGTTRAPVWPRWLLEKIGEVMAEEVANLVEDGTVLPPQVEDYLKKLAARNADANLTIEPTLVLNEKAKFITNRPPSSTGGPQP